jgi:ABC-type transporter Mla MlaB component
VTSDDDRQGAAWIEVEQGPVLFLTGDLDASVVPVLDQKVDELLASPEEPWVVDLAGVRSADGRGVAPLARLAGGDRPIVLRSVPDGLRPLLAAAGLPPAARAGPPAGAPPH